jgi:hypothetical protein
MKIAIVIIASLICRVVAAQYDVTAYQGHYEEIEDFNSIALETFGDLYWEKEFELPFSFKYFDTTFNSLLINVEGLGILENEIDFSLRLMAFGYMFDNVLDPYNIESDVRYKYGEKEGKDYLVVQFTKNRLFSDTSIEEYNSYVNFQYWFFDDGTIELRFGPSNLDNSPVYVPGEGFYLLTDQGAIPAGPQLALYHPYNENIRLEYNDLDSHEEYEINTDGTGSIDWWPPDGWVIKFSNQLVSTNETVTNNSNKIHPNPTTGQVYIDSEEVVKLIELYSTSGKLIIRSSVSTLDLSLLNSGIYYLRVMTNKSLSNYQIIKL